MTHTPPDARARPPSRRRAPRPLALVKHLHGAGFTVIDATSHRPLGTVGGGSQPHAMAVHPVGRWAFVPYMSSARIETIDLRGPTVVGSVPTGTAPVGAALSRCGRFLLVGTYGPMADATAPGLAVYRTDVSTGALSPAEWFELGPCAGIAINDTNEVWVALKEGDAVARLSGPPFSVRATIDVPEGPQGLTSLPEYGLVAVDCVGADRVAFVDAAADRVLESVEAPNPRGGAVASDRFFVADTEGDGLAVVDLASLGGQAGVDVERVSLGTPTAFSDATSDGSLVVVDAEDDDRVTFLDPESLGVVARVRTGKRPHHAQFTADGRACYVPNRGADTVTVLDTSDPDSIEPVAEISVPDGAGPSGCFFTDRRRFA